jgi:hypothetical protein
MGIMWLLRRYVSYWEWRAEWLAELAIDPTSPFGMLKAAIEDCAVAITTSTTPAFMALKKVASDIADSFAYFTAVYTESQETTND